MIQAESSDARKTVVGAMSWAGQAGSSPRGHFLGGIVSVGLHDASRLSSRCYGLANSAPGHFLSGKWPGGSWAQLQMLPASVLDPAYTNFVAGPTSLWKSAGTTPVKRIDVGNGADSSPNARSGSRADTHRAWPSTPPSPSGQAATTATGSRTSHLGP